MTTKLCKCKTHEGENPVPIENFSNNKREKDGLCTICKACTKAYKKSYYAVNKETIIKKACDWQSENKSTVNQKSRNYRKNNKEQRAITSKNWRQANKGIVTFHANNRRKVIKQATPIWADLDKIKNIYIEAGNLTSQTGVEHHVHHVIPLTENKNVCGLHCEANLIILTQREHMDLHSNLT